MSDCSYKGDTNRSQFQISGHIAQNHLVNLCFQDLKWQISGMDTGHSGPELKEDLTNYTKRSELTPSGWLGPWPPLCSDKSQNSGFGKNIFFYFGGPKKTLIQAMVWEISRADYVKNSYFTICSSKTVPWIKKF